MTPCDFNYKQSELLQKKMEVEVAIKETNLSYTESPVPE